MNYSRRQLEALGEPLGECVTRKEGGRIIYGGGGGSSAPATQTQVSDIPDWAKPYAQETLEKTKGLTAAPYQAYGAPRIAGFSPLQEQAQQAAAGMQPSQLGQFGGQVAGAASLGALGTQYSPFRMGQFTSGRAAQYMNPFLEQAMEPQLREAQRASEIQKQADQAAAVRAGAFGGGRQAIIEAERQRNLGSQLGDIRARGYMSAFDQAQQQFAREQQLREQSRQFGAGLGMQGFQTALQGAGQMGALGQQQFGQEMDINRLQQQVGAQQQALRQQGLTQAYQDFLNEQNYPYKQLGFMSDMIRGLPLGQQSTRQLYEPPGSMLGQLGGIGTGLLGLSSAAKTFGGFAEGGEVAEYADGGSVDAPDNVAKIVNDLSDAQLAQAKQAAQARGDFAQLQAIMVEEGMRASERGGLAGAFNQLPYEQQEEMMAGGGIVAFADGGDSSYDVLEQKRLDRPVQRPRPAPPRRAAPVSPAVHQGINMIAAQTGAPRETVEASYERILRDIESKDAADIKAISDMVAKSTGGSKEVKEGALGRALAEFGFKWAASAAKPGARFLSSAAEAAPTLSASVAESEKLAREMDRNDLKLQTAQKQFELARRADNRKEAGVFAGQIEQLRRQQEMLELKRQELAQQQEFQRGSLANQRAQLARGVESDRVRGITAMANLQRAQASVAEVGRKAGLDFDNSRAARDLMKQLTEKHGPDKAKYFYAQERRNYVREATQGARDRAEEGARVQNVFDLLGQE